ncbi:MAG: tetratricopeptide repeat protein [bacterium]|nr:tetratricopeptide repeat protein [bacterium]
MSLIYNITIKPTAKENSPEDFSVTWHEEETGKTSTIESTPEITTEETEWLWRLSKFQLTIGQKLYRFLEGDTQNFQRALEKAKRKNEDLQLHLSTCKQIADWPFELLAKDGTYLLNQRLHLVRKETQWGKQKHIPPQNRPLKLLFMATSAIDVKPESDFEGEEEAIFKITAHLPIHIDVEDSGTLKGLREKLELDEYEVIHLSGHAKIDQSGRPYFLMEDETGHGHPVYPEELWHEALIENPPRLLFLSGDQTGEAPAKPGETGNKAGDSFARQMVEIYHVPAVLGWGQRVNDTQAANAGKKIYHELSKGKTILEAVRQGRNELITGFPGVEKPAWPMLRLFSTGIPLTSIVKKNQPKLTQIRTMRYKYLNGSQVKVLAEGFVGRRRQLQTALGALQPACDKVGVTLLGTAGLGKSCLAGKICERYSDHTLIIVHGRFNAITLEAALTEAFNKTREKKGQRLLDKKIDMKDKLAELCATAFLEKNYLLLLDDFEQNLEGVKEGQPGAIIPEAAKLLEALLNYLHLSGKMTQLIITSRYEFTVTVEERELVAEQLQSVWLTGFRKAEQRKKARTLENIANYPHQTLTTRLLTAGHGNPRLMEWIDKLVGEMKETETGPLLEAVKDKQEDYIRQHVIRELLHRAGEKFEHFLRSFSIYRIPVQIEGAAQVMKKRGMEKKDQTNSKEHLYRGMGLSLIEHDQARHTYRVTPVLREELLKNHEENAAGHEAALEYYKKKSDAMEELGRILSGSDYDKINAQMEMIDPIITEEIIYHALGSGREDIATGMGGVLLTHLTNRIAAEEALRIGMWILDEKKRTLRTGNDAFLLNSIAYTYTFFAQHQKVIHYSRQALDIFRTVFGPGHPNNIIALNSLGMAYTTLGNNREAIGYYREALDITGKTTGKNGLGTSLLANNLGTAYRNLGEYRKAIRYFKQALVISKKKFLQDHHSTVRILNNLGAAYDDLGDYPQAIDYYGQVLTLSMKMYEEKHPNISTVMNNLGFTYIRMAEYQKAVGYLEQALSIDRALYGEEHPEVAKELQNLGVCFNALADYPKAVDHLERALAIYTRTYGPEHPRVATVMNSLGEAGRKRGEHHKTIESLQEALRIDEAAYGKNHPATAVLLSDIGTAYMTSGEYRKATGYYRQALDIWRNFYEENHPQIATGLNNLGEALNTAVEHKKAIEYFNQSLHILNAAFGNEHPNIAGTLNNKGLAYKALGQYPEAIENLKQAHVMWKNSYGEKHPKVAQAMNNIATALNASGKHGEALEYLRQAMQITKRGSGETHPDMSPILNNMGEAYSALGQHTKAIDHYQQALSNWKHAYGENNPRIPKLLIDLGDAHRATGQTREAITHYRQSLAIIKKIFKHNHPLHALALNRLGLALLDTSQHKTAIDSFERELTINRALYGEEHQEVVTGLTNLGVVWEALNQYEKAGEYYEGALREIKKLEEGRQPQTQTTLLLNLLGAMYYQVGKMKKAAGYYEEVLEIREKSNEKENTEAADALNNLGLTYYELGENQKAARNFEKAYEIFHRENGPEHPDTVTLSNNLALARGSIKPTEKQ